MHINAMKRNGQLNAVKVMLQNYRTDEGFAKHICNSKIVGEGTGIEFNFPREIQIRPLDKTILSQFDYEVSDDPIPDSERNLSS